jgi:selenocysteine lyase/cysteine desulfurase
MQIDFLSADGHKWLLGPEGAGIFYCRRELLSRTRPLIVGWLNVVNATDFANYDFTLRSDAGRFESGSHNVVGLLGLKASVELLLSAGIDAISRRIRALTDRLIMGLQSKGYSIASPRDGQAWSGIVSFASTGHDHAALVRALRMDHHIEIALRVGRLRCSPHFYNTQDQMDRLLDVLPSGTSA